MLAVIEAVYPCMAEAPRPVRSVRWWLLRSVFPDAGRTLAASVLDSDASGLYWKTIRKRLGFSNSFLTAPLKTIRKTFLFQIVFSILCAF